MKPMHDCWNRSGVWGDRTCAQLEEAIHCRNCPTYSRAATEVLDRAVDAEYLANATQRIRATKQIAARDSESVVIFRLGGEWLGLPANVFDEVCAPRRIHSLPHRRGGTVLGIANIRGTLVVCVSLHALLGIAPVTAPNLENRRLVHARLLVTLFEGKRLAFPVDEIHGLHRYAAGQLATAPETVLKSTATYARSVLPWQEKTVGLLDGDLLFYSLNKGLA